jgi:two-component system response regulator PilR (NtrC family)/two-component system response regulator HydG
MKESILIVEDEAVLLTNLCEMLERAGYDVCGASDAESALALALERSFAVVLTDIRLPKMDGIELLERLLAERPETLVILTTAFASLDTALKALRHGAYDYLLKPVAFEDLRRKLEQLLRFRALKREVIHLRRDLHSRLGFEGLVGDSPAIRAIFALIDRVAPTRATVLVTGESGTGKELVARGIHARSSVADQPFMAINMAALPIEMVEGLLFGHERGAFTGAERQREGLLRSVNGGTVFLDEIGELPLGAQAKLLRAIETREVLPLGANRAVPVDFRLIAATNKDLESAIKDGRFRQDLYFRVNVFRIDVTPLRERREDIPALVSHFVGHHCRNLGRPPLTVSAEAARMLREYAWPGNVRELSNVIERAAILAVDQTIDPEHLPAELGATVAAPTDLRLAMQRAERQHIASVLSMVGGAREKAAALLGIDPATLYRKTVKRDGD